MLQTIPFNRPSLAGDELEFVRAAIESGHTSMDGQFTLRVRELLRDAHGAADVLLTTSCTDALEMSALLLDISPGDVVIVPSFTFVSTALAFVRAGATIRFADIEPVTLGIDPASVEPLLDDRVRAVIPVHYAGVACRITELTDMLEGSDVALIEDNAHGLFASLGDKPLGTYGRFSTLSFHETKNFICGEGGALVVNDPEDLTRAHVLKDKGTNRREFFLGLVDKYSWQDIGSSFGMSDILAGFLYGQLEQKDAVLVQRRRVYDGYVERLAPIADSLDVTLPTIPSGAVSGYHLFHVLLRDRQSRDTTLLELREEGIQATFHYVPLHSSPGGRRFGEGMAHCPVTDDVSGRLLRLPFYNTLTEADLDRVCETFVASLRGQSGARGVASTRG